MGTRERLLLALAVGALLSLVALFAYAPIFAVDFHWHLELGKLIARQHAIPRIDMFSAVHPERPYVQFQWLWELLAYGAYALGGLRGVRWFQVATLTASFVALGLAARRLLPSRALAFALCALALVLFEDRFQARPAATVLGFLALILVWLVDAQARARRSTRWLVLAIACLWSNIHGGESLLMLACFGALLVGALLSLRSAGSRADVVRDARLTLFCLVGILLSPAFFAGLLDWAHAIGPQLASRNKEWLPSYTMLENGLSPSHLLIALGPTLVALAYVVEQRARRHARAAHPWAEWLLCGGLLLLAQLTVRNAFLCLVPLVFMATRLPTQLPPRVPRLIGALACVLLLVAFHDHVVVGYGGLAQAAETLEDDLAPNTFPVELARFMHEAQLEGGIINDGRWGGFLIWELWPRCHVFVDTRHDLTDEMWPIFLASHVPHTRPAAIDAAFARWGIELAVFRGPTFPLIVPMGEWQLLYKAGDQELYQHVRGAHAPDNRERARRWLAQYTTNAALDSDFADAATRVGAARWLAEPDQRRVHERALEQLDSQNAADRMDGLTSEAKLAFDAGAYARSFELAQQLVQLDLVSTQALYRYALSAYVIQQRAQTSWALARLRTRTEELNPTQRGRLALLERALAAVAP